MFGLTRLWNAVATLAANLEALAATVGLANAGLRERLQLEGPAEPAPGHADAPAALAPPSPAANGKPRGRRQTV